MQRTYSQQTQQIYTRLKFDFKVTPIPRAEKGTQKVVLPCPVINGVARHGWLFVSWNKKSATVRWSYGAFDCCYPQCDWFKAMLEEINWDRELIRRLIKEAGWNYHPLDEGHTRIRWNSFSRIPHSIAQWILDTLPGVYQATVQRFDAIPKNRDALSALHMEPPLKYPAQIPS